MDRSWKLIIVGMVGLFVTGSTLAVLLLALGIRAVTPQTALDRVRAAKELRVWMDTGAPPWSGNPPMIFTNEGGKLDGLDYRLAQKIAAQLGVGEVRVLHKTYPELVPALLATPTKEEDRGDLMMAGYIPHEAPGVAWSEPYLDFGLCLIVAADAPIRSVRDLSGRVVGMYEDDGAEAEVRKLAPDAREIRRFEQGYLELLISGGLDGFIYDYPFAVEEIRIHYERFPQHKGRLRIAQYNLTDSHYVVGVRAAEPELLASVNAAIRAWRADPAYAAALGELLVPPAAGGEIAAAGSEAQEPGTHLVRSGDTLKSVARERLGAEGRWKDLWAWNRSRIPNPEVLVPGERLVLSAPQ